MSQVWFSGIVAATVTPIIVGWITNSTRAVQADREGWKTIRPGLGIYALVAAAAAFSLLLFYIYFFVGSSRADAEEQMLWCVGLAIAFMVMGLLLLWAALRESVQWRGRFLRVVPIFGSMQMLKLDELDDVSYSSSSSMFILRFRQGQVVKISPYMDGTRQLLQSLE